MNQIESQSELVESVVRTFLLVPMIGAKLIWMVNPQTLPCLVFWLLALTWNVMWIRKTRRSVMVVLWLIVIVGLVLNALVTLSNGGRMPVIGYFNSDQSSIWMLATEDHYFLPLCDRLFGFSIGDVLCFSALPVVVIMKILVAHPEWVEVAKKAMREDWAAVNPQQAGPIQ